MNKRVIILIFVLLSGVFLAACNATEPERAPNQDTPVPDSIDVEGTTDVPESAPSSEKLEVSWSEALDLLNSGNVELVSQSHNLEVSLSLKDGRILTTIEPETDAIFEAINECGEICSNIILVSE